MKHGSRLLRGAPVPALVLSALCLAACGSSDSTTQPAPPMLVTETFSGSIGQNETAIHSFSVTASTNSVLVGYTSLSPASVTALGLGIANWNAATQTCGLNLSQNDAARSGSTGLSGTAGTGYFCVRVYDGGNIPADVTVSYTLQVQHY